MNAEELRKLSQLSKDLRLAFDTTAISGGYCLVVALAKPDLHLWEVAANAAGWNFEIRSNDVVLTPSDPKKWERLVKGLQDWFAKADREIVQAASKGETHTSVVLQVHKGEHEYGKYIRLWAVKKGLDCTVLGGGVSLSWADVD